MLNAQLNGLGTSGSPYNGTFQGNLQWNSTNFPSGKVYINGDVIIDNELLTIGPGMTIIFVATGSDLIINGTGQLNASGSSASKITFTADYTPYNGVFGETGERWGHISFESTSSADSSLMKFCTVEYGSKTGSGIDSHGGGVNILFSKLRITDCSIRNNLATWGGGIFVDRYVNPVIIRTHVYLNSANEAGGGFYLWDGSAATLKNCIVDQNSCSVLNYNLGGGGFFMQGTGSAKVINCIVANNLVTGNRGVNVYIYGTNNGSFINSIIWSDENSMFFDGAYQASNLQNSAIQRVYNASGTILVSSFTNCYDLNSSNSAADGPNFTDPSSPTYNYSILFTSPCRDAGTYYIDGPPTDIIGKSRIGNYDIGAYEVQYSRWKAGGTPTNWQSTDNWEQLVNPGSGSATGDVIIPMLGNETYIPVISGTTVIPAGKYMILEPGAKATFSTLTTTGTLKLQSDADYISSLIIDNDNATAQVDLYLTGGGDIGSYKWHYISTPFSTDVPVTTFTGVTFDIAGYNEPRVTTDPAMGWIGYDGWIYSTPAEDYDPLYEFTDLKPTRGYEFWDNNSFNKFTISGTLNYTDVTPTVTFKSGGIPSASGYNLLGNPFPSGLNWDYIITHNFPDNTSKSLYFTLNNNLASYINGVGVPDGVDGFIPPMQGFMIKTYVENHVIPLAADARTHSMHSRYKGSTQIPLVRLKINEDLLSDETVVRFDEAAKTGLDNDFDAVKMSVSPEKLLLYSSMGGTNYVINGQPFPDTFVEIPLVINLKKSGNHTITTSPVQGLENYSVSLLDKETGFVADLKTTSLITFNASAGTIPDRFILKVGNVLTSTEDPIASKGIFNVYSGNNMINIQTISDEWDGKSGSIKVYDISGKTSTDVQNNEFRKNSVIQVEAPGVKGLYFVEIKSGLKRYVGKVVIR